MSTGIEVSPAAVSAYAQIARAVLRLARLGHVRGEPDEMGFPRVRLLEIGLYLDAPDNVNFSSTDIAGNIKSVSIAMPEGRKLAEFLLLKSKESVSP